MSEIIAGGILGISLLSVLFILNKKIPVLLSFPASTEEDFRNTLKKTKDSLVHSSVGKVLFSPDVMLQRLLSQIWIVALRIECKTSRWLESLRHHSQEKSIEEEKKFSQNYWGQLKEKEEVKK